MGEPDVGSDGTGGSATTTGGDSSGTTSDCDTAQCGIPAPSGWNGPVVVVEADDPESLPPCNAPFSAGTTDLFRGWHEPLPATCSCSCELADDPYCFGWVAPAPAAQCAGFADTTDVTSGCFDIEFVSTFFYAADPIVSQVDEHVVVDRPALTWDRVMRLCQADVDCESGACDIPEGFAATSCVHTDGETDCPSDGYTDRHVLYAGADDTRDCGGCTCPDTTLSCVGASLAVHPEPGCDGEPTVVPPGDACQEVGGKSVQTNYDPLPEIVPLSSPAAMGTATPSGVVTLCCLP